jgi:hypothetical protein
MRFRGPWPARKRSRGSPGEPVPVVYGCGRVTAPVRVVVGLGPLVAETMAMADIAAWPYTVSRRLVDRGKGSPTCAGVGARATRDVCCRGAG